MPSFHREQDVGKPIADPVTVNRIDEVIAGLETNRQAIDEVNQELKILKTAQDLILGQKVEEE